MSRLLRDVYDALVQFASNAVDGTALTSARKDFIARTGDLFESDDAFERRICAFLEWYTLDRVDAAGLTQLQHFAHTTGSQDAVWVEAIGAWRFATLSLFSIVKMRTDHFVVDDLLLSQRHVVPLQPILVGLKPKDVVAARLVMWQGQAELTDGISYFPQSGNTVLLRIAKHYRKGRVPGVSKLDLVHRLIYLTNRCDRYRHVDPKRIFAEGEAQVMQNGATAST